MQDIVGWDVRTWSKAVDFWDARVAAAPPALRCLEIGAGPGGPSLWLALKGHDVVCSNNLTSEHRAAPLHRRHGVYERIEYRDIDATAIPYRDEFDIVVFKSVLGGVDSDGLVSQRKAIDEMRLSLKPGGRLLFAENLLATPLHRLARRVAWRSREGGWRFPAYRELNGLLQEFSRLELHTTGVGAMFGVNERYRRSLAAVDEALLNRLVPASWRYIAYGVATR
jgi:SAM-dependent methyltransferase